MARAKTVKKPAEKLTLSPLSPENPPAPPADAQLDISDFPNPLSYINALAQQHDGDDWGSRVYQIVGSGGRGQEKSPFLFPAEMEELPNLEMRLARQYPAGGRFKVVCFRNQQIVKNIFLEIAPRPGYVAPAQSWEQPVAAPAPHAPAESMAVLSAIDRMAEFMMRQTEANNAMFRAIEARLAAPVTPAPDPQSFLTNTMTLFRTFQEMVPKAAGESGLQMLKDGIELGKTLGGTGAGSAEPAGLMGVITRLAESEAGKTLVTALANTMQHEQQQQRGANQQTRPAQIPAPHQQQQRPAPQPVNQQDQLAQGMELLFQRAAAGHDPAAMAEQVAAVLPPQIWDALMEADNATDYLQSIFPRVAQHRAWFEAVIANLFEEDDNDSEESDAGLDAATDHTTEQNDRVAGRTEGNTPHAPGDGPLN